MSKKQDNAADAAAQSTASASSEKEKRSLAEKIADFKEYLILSRRELSKVSWPNWKVTRKTSIVVLGFIVVMSILLGLADLVLSGLIRLILS